MFGSCSSTLGVSAVTAFFSGSTFSGSTHRYTGTRVTRAPRRRSSSVDLEHLLHRPKPLAAEDLAQVVLRERYASTLLAKALCEYAKARAGDSFEKKRMLAALPGADFRRLLPHLKTIAMRRKQVLLKQGERLHHVCFPNGGVCSVTTVLSDGSMVAAATVGDEGMLGIGCRRNANCAKPRVPQQPDVTGCEVAMSTSPHQEVLERIRAEYLEMPGMRLKVEQVQRLCGVQRSICKVVLDSLVEAKFLCLKSDGSYARLTEGDLAPPRPAKADLQSNTFVTGSHRREAS